MMWILVLVPQPGLALGGLLAGSVVVYHESRNIECLVRKTTQSHTGPNASAKEKGSSNRMLRDAGPGPFVAECY